MKKSAGYIAPCVFWYLLVGHTEFLLKHVYILYIIIHGFSPGDFVASKLDPILLREDLCQGSNQVRNQVLRHQGKFWFVEGSEQSSSFEKPSWATGKSGNVFFQKNTDKYSYMVDIQTNKQSVIMQSLDLRHLLEEFQCNLALIAPLACRDGGIKTWSRRSVMRRVKRFHSDTAYWSVDLTWLFLFDWSTYWPQDCMGSKSGLQILSWQLGMKIHFFRACPPNYRVSNHGSISSFLQRSVWLPSCEQIWKGLGRLQNSHDELDSPWNIEGSANQDCVLKS